MESTNLKIPKHVTKKKNFSNTSTFKNFKDEYPEHSNVETKVLLNIINHFNNVIHNTIINERYGVQLPEGLGIIYLAACDKPDNLKYYYNDGNKIIEKKDSLEADELLLKIFYTNNGKGYKIANSQLWGFEACRSFKRKASSNFKYNYRKYIRISKEFKLKAQFENYLKNERSLKYKEFTNKENKGFNL